MFRYTFSELTLALCAKYNNYPGVGTEPCTVSDDIKGQIDVFIEQFQECTTPEEFQRCLQEHMFNDPWSWTIFPFFEEYERSGSKDPVEIVLDDGSVIQCNVIF